MEQPGENVGNGNRRQHCRRKLKYVNFLQSAATECTTGCQITSPMPHARRHYVQSRQCEADYFGAVILGVKFTTAWKPTKMLKQKLKHGRLSAQS